MGAQFLHQSMTAVFLPPDLVAYRKNLTSGKEFQYPIIYSDTGTFTLL